jgi:hypothetical protein
MKRGKQRIFEYSKPIVLQRFTKSFIKFIIVLLQMKDKWNSYSENLASGTQDV